MRLIYPAVFYPFENGNGYTVEVPDLPGCVSEGDTLADAILMVTDAACGWVLDELESGDPAPTATSLENVCAEEGGIVNLIVLDMDPYAEKYGKKAIRKNITIPAYMNTYIEKHGLSLSRVTQDAISGYMLTQG